MRSRLFAIALIFLAFHSRVITGSPTATGTAKLTVIQAISIAKVSDLDFQTAAQGSPAETISPGNSENAGNASFDVTGNPGSTFAIQLPTGPIPMIGENGGSIPVLNFTSNPANSSTIPVSGANAKRTIYVGATRTAIPANAPTGAYTGSFAVTVVYQ